MQLQAGVWVGATHSSPLRENYLFIGYLVQRPQVWKPSPRVKGHCKAETLRQPWQAEGIIPRAQARRKARESGLRQIFRKG